MKPNALTVIFDLGGGQHGNLGLVLYPIEYALLSNEHYVSPVQPGFLVTPQVTTQHEPMCLNKYHGEDIRLFRETLDVEKSPIKQIVAVIGKDHLKEICNARTKTIIISITQVLLNLVTAYGMLDSDVLDIEEAKVWSLFWNLSDHPVQIYNTIEYLFDTTEAENLHKSTAQVIKFVLEIIWKYSDIEQALTDWFNRSTEYHIWNTYKTHFTTTHRELKQVMGTTLQKTPFHQANHMTEKLKSESERIRYDVLTRANDLIH